MLPTTLILALTTIRACKRSANIVMVTVNVLSLTSTAGLMVLVAIPVPNVATAKQVINLLPRSRINLEVLLLSVSL